MTDRQWAPCTAFDTGEVPIADIGRPAGHEARTRQLSRQLQFERSRLETLTAPPVPASAAAASSANPAAQAYARRLRYRIGVLRLRLAARSLLTTGTRARP